MRKKLSKKKQKKGTYNFEIMCSGGNKRKLCHMNDVCASDFRAIYLNGIACVKLTEVAQNLKIASFATPLWMLICVV